MSVVRMPEVVPQPTYTLLLRRLQTLVVSECADRRAQLHCTADPVLKPRQQITLACTVCMASTIHQATAVTCEG